MVSGSIPRYEPLGNDPAPSGFSQAYPELARTLEQHVQDGLSSDLSLDLVLNELVAHATAATKASAAAIALARGEEMVCRATTGDHAPDLGMPLNTRDGLSGACLHSREAQLCRDTQSDSRVDGVASQRLGIRSMLIVPVRDSADVIGVVEIFSPRPNAFSDADRALLESYASDCGRLRRMATELARRLPHPAEISRPFLAPVLAQAKSRGLDLWVMILSALVILAAAGLSFLIGSRTGWLRLSPRPSVSETSKPPASPAENSVRSPVPRPPASSAEKPAVSAAASGGLVVYENGKVIFRMSPGSSQSGQSATKKGLPIPASPLVWLAPEAAENRLVQRIEPEYPADARAAHRSGDVVLEVTVHRDGTVAAVHALSGDPMLAKAATDAVRSWRYEPYRLQGRPVEFQTEVTLKFALPE